MLQPYRTRSLRRIKIKLPGGRKKIQYKRRRPSKAIDPITGQKLHGVVNLIPSQLRKLPKTAKRPQRPFGGVLSSRSMRKEILKRFNLEKSSSLEIGQVVVKTAGREAGKLCVIVEKLDNKYVLIDGQVRRKKCNISHLEAIDKKIKIKAKATTETIKKELKALNIEVKKTKSKPKKERPVKKREVKEKPKKEETKKPIKKDEVKKKDKPKETKKKSK